LAAIMGEKVEEMEAVWLQEYKRIFKVTHNN
jgi:hypothetical protein